MIRRCLIINIYRSNTVFDLIVAQNKKLKKRHSMTGDISLKVTVFNLMVALNETQDITAGFISKNHEHLFQSGHSQFPEALNFPPAPPCG